MAELTYHIEPEESDQQRALIISIPPPMTLAQLKKTAVTRQDQEVMTFLIQEEEKFQRRQGKSINALAPIKFFHVSYPQTTPALKLLAAAGKLFFKGKSIVCDLFGKTEFFYEIKRDAAGKKMITGKLKTSDKEFDLSACDFVCAGPPHWFIKGIILKFINTDATWNEIKKAYVNEIDENSLLDEPDNPLAPKLIFSEGFTHTPEIKIEPMPLLILKDRTGAFADLKMEYGTGCTISFEDKMVSCKDSNGKTIQRIHEAEKNWEKDLLETGFIKKISGTSHYYCPMDKVSKSLSFLLEIGWNVRDNGGNRLVQQSKSDLSMESHHETIRVQGKIKFQEYEADLSTVAGAFNRRDRFLNLGTGTIALLPDNWDAQGLTTLFEEGEVVGTGLEVKKGRISSLGDLWEKQPSIACTEDLVLLKNACNLLKGFRLLYQQILSKGFYAPISKKGSIGLLFFTISASTVSLQTIWAWVKRYKC